MSVNIIQNSLLQQISNQTQYAIKSFTIFVSTSEPYIFKNKHVIP